MPNSPPKPSASLSFAALDGLRLLASLNIVLLHLEASGGLHSLKGVGWYFLPIKAPLFNSSMFLVLAGFLYTSIYAMRAENPAFLPLLKKQFFRLMPLHLFASAIMATLVFLRNGEDLTNVVISFFLHASLIWPFAPVWGHTLNYPSWALAAFFLCYSVFPFFYRILVREKRPLVLIFAAILCVLPMLAWGFAYHIFPDIDDRYRIFHIFPLSRLWEFLLGCLLAQLHIVVRFSTSRWGATLLAILGISLLYYSQYTSSLGELLLWITNHVLRPILYGILIFSIAGTKGPMQWLLALPPVRILGRASFYPYLLHIPLMSLTSAVAEIFFAYRTWLHHPVNIMIFCFLLYFSSAIFEYYKRKQPRHIPSR